MALSRCTDQLAAGAGDQPGLGASVSMLIGGRRRVRTTLGLPADELDKVESTGGFPPDDAFQGRLPPGHAASRIGGAGAVLAPGPGRAGPRTVADAGPDPRDRAVRPAPRVGEPATVAEDGVRIVMVPITVNQLLDYAARTNGDPLHASTRSQLLRERYDQDGGLPWPPQRNEHCWCGSGRKYKKCCATVE